ncbi:MAG: carboxypeptidase regulatory-like domain-containing protein [Flavobacterium sp.]|nr:MAG: carboxypeptidase regulatory-like domain-containing protein [Flavobacterium sp.]
MVIHKDQSLENFFKKIEDYTVERPQEKIHLHFDKPYYSIGDDIWFEGYVVNAEKNELSSRSGVLHVDFLDENDSLRKALLLPIENGLAQGQINLTDSLFNAGNYRINAYTKWMLNFDEAYHFSKSIPVGDALNETVIADAKFNLSTKNQNVQLGGIITYKDLNSQPEESKEVNYKLLNGQVPIHVGTAITNSNGQFEFKYTLKKNIDPNELVLQTSLKRNLNSQITRNFNVNILKDDFEVQFFPEGGHLVTGLRSKVAFKVLGADGFGLNLSGYVEDQNGTKIIELNTEHAGMGMFAFAPKSGIVYKAIFKANGVEKRFRLPLVQNSGYVLSINHLNGDELLSRIESVNPTQKNEELILVGQINGVVKYLSKLDISKASTVFKIPKKMLNNGMAHFTLFSSDYLPLAQRLVFINQKDKLKTTISTDKVSYGKREKVNLNLLAEDDRSTGIIGSFSVSVVHKGKVNSTEENEISILSNLLLTSDLKGYIERPNYYFDGINEQKIRHLDLLLLTQGWTRFKWDDVLTRQKGVLKHKAEKSLQMSGTIVNLVGKPIPNGKVNLFAPGLLLLLDTIADANGRFAFNNLNFPDSSKIIIRAKNAKDKNNAKIILDEEKDIKYKKRQTPISFINNQGLLSYLNETQRKNDLLSKNGFLNKKTTTLKEVEIRGNRPPAIKYSAVPENFRPDITITQDKLQNAGDVASALFGLNGLIIKNNKVYARRTREEGQLMIVYNGQTIDDLSGISQMSLSGIQVFKGASADGLATYFPPIQEPNIKPKPGEETKPAVGIIFLTSNRSYTGPRPNGFNLLKPKGYAITKEFYSPSYEVAANKPEVPDLRSTIYWMPSLITDQDGKANTSFYTADEPGTYQVTVEGVAIGGKLARQTYSFVVK